MNKEIRSHSRPALVFLLVFLWVIAILATYFVFHKPFQLPFANRILRIVFQLATSISIVLAGSGLGNLLAPAWTDRHAINVFIQSGLGLGILSIGYYIMGWTIGVDEVTSWLVIATLLLVLRNHVKMWWFSAEELSSVWRPTGRFGKWISWGALVAGILSLIVALVPPARYDALVYHLSFPKQYLELGRIQFIPNFFWGMPQLGESLYTLANAMAGIETATILGWMVGWISLLGMAGFTGMRFGPQSGWVALTAPIAGYTLFTMLSSGYVDWFSFLYGAETIVCLILWIDRRDERYVWLAGIFSGFALGTKYTAGALVLAVILVLITIGEKGKIRRAVSYLVLSGLVFSPWLIKNFIATGNPFFPLLIPTGLIDTFRLANYPIPVWGDWRDVWLLPLRASMIGNENLQGYNASIGPIFLLLAPFAFISSKVDNSHAAWGSKVLKITALAGIVIWALAGRFSGYLLQARLYFSLFPAYSILTGIGFQRISHYNFAGARSGRIVSIVVCLLLYLSVIEVGIETTVADTPRYLAGSISADEFLRNKLGWYYPTMQAIQALPAGSTVMMLWETRSYYCTPVCIPDEIIDRWRHSLYQYGDSSTIIEHWQSQGITHILFYKAGAQFVKSDDPRYTIGEWLELDRFLSALSLVKQFGDSYELYRLP